MLEEIKKKLKIKKEVVRNVPKILAESTFEECAEIKDLNLTEVDKLQGDIVASVAIAAMGSMGIPCSATMKTIIATAAAYAIRDFKEGSTNPEKLLVMRVINKIQEIKQAKAEELNKK